MPATKRILSKLVRQGTDESRTYTADLTNWVDEWGAIQSIESCTLINRRTGEDKSSLLSGTAGFSGTVVESQTVSGLAEKTYYQLNILVNFPSSQQLSGYWLIKGET